MGMFVGFSLQIYCVLKTCKPTPMKPIITLTLLLATIFLATNCGLSEREKSTLLQHQKDIDDSIRSAQITQIKEVEKEKSALSDSLTYYSNLLSRQKNSLIQVRTSLYTANDQMTQIKAFHLGRMPIDKESQIRNQEVFIQSLYLQQDSTQAVIRSSTERIVQVRMELATLK
jgi:hypothetical protein